MTPRKVPLSVLDLSTISEGSTPQAALASTIELAKHTEGLGFERFWVAEHHNSRGIASSAPAVLISAIASATARIRVGSGGVMLPNHPSLVVAEQFGMLESLFPGRIDLGVGRAPGTDQRTARALRRNPESLGADDFPEQLMDLIYFLQGQFPEGHPMAGLSASPVPVTPPAMWLLGSSGYSAQVAGMLGLPFGFAHHFSAHNTLPALELYRKSFRPSVILEEPYALIGVRMVIAEDDDRAEWLAGSGYLAFLNLASGRPGPVPSPETAAAYAWTEHERAMVADRRESQVVGSPATAAAKIEELLDRTGVDELMVTTMIHDPAARLETYTRVAGLFN